MNIVLYTVDFEPITVLNLPMWVIEEAERRGVIRIPVHEPAISDNVTQTSDAPKTVDIACYNLTWHDNTTKPVLVTPDDELALMLKPDWLPGQRATINAYQRCIQQLADGLVRAMKNRRH